MPVIDLEPKQQYCDPINDAYEIYVDVVEARSDEEYDDEFGVIRDTVTTIIENKQEAIACINQMQDLYHYILNPGAIANIKDDDLRYEIEGIFKEEHHKLYISKIAVAYYDIWGRKCSVEMKEE